MIKVFLEGKEIGISVYKNSCETMVMLNEDGKKLVCGWCIRDNSLAKKLISDNSIPRSFLNNVKDTDRFWWFRTDYLFFKDTIPILKNE